MKLVSVLWVLYCLCNYCNLSLPITFSSLDVLESGTMKTSLSRNAVLSSSVGFVKRMVPFFLSFVVENEISLPINISV